MRQDIQREMHQAGPVAFGKIANRCDKRRRAVAQLDPCIRLRILADDGAGRLAARFLKRPDSAERTRIVGRPNERASPSTTECAAHLFSDALNWPSPSSSTRAASPRCSVSLTPATIPLVRARTSRRPGQARAEGSRRPGRSSRSAPTSPDSARRAIRPDSCWRRNTWHPDAGYRSQ